MLTRRQIEDVITFEELRAALAIGAFIVLYFAFFGGSQ